MKRQMNQKVVFEHTIKVEVWQIEEMVELINKRCIDPDEGENLLTLEELLDSPKLLKYLCVEWLEDNQTPDSMEEHLHGDGWWDWREYRKKKYKK